MNLLTFKHLPIFQQLQLEESLLRANDENWVIINQGSPKAIVLGISANAEEVVNLPLATKDKIPLIKRFSGGGTVFVDEDTLFVTFIFQKKSHSFEPFPKSILDWVGSLFKQTLSLPHFSIKENDFALGEKKVGGNAQYIKKERWLHHTSFLWDFKKEHMNYLLHPPKEPSYRQKRSHLDFLTTLSPLISKDLFEERLISTLSSHFPLSLNPPLPHFSDHRKTTLLL